MTEVNLVETAAILNTMPMIQVGPARCRGGEFGVTLPDGSQFTIRHDGSVVFPFPVNGRTDLSRVAAEAGAMVASAIGTKTENAALVLGRLVMLAVTGACRRSASVLAWREVGAGSPLVALVVTNRRWGGWSTPGGKLEPGEPPVVGALRELEEETGLVPVHDPQFLGAWIHESVPKDEDKRPWLHHVFEAAVDFGIQPLKLEPGTQAGWMAAGDLVTETLYPDFYRRALADSYPGVNLAARCFVTEEDRTNPWKPTGPT